MNRLPARIRESNLAAAAIVAVAFLALHVYAVGHYFARPPAPDISREVELARTALDQTITLRRRVLTLPAPDGRTATVVAADGPSTRFMDVDRRGTILDRRDVALDLTGSVELAGRRLAEGRVVIYQLAGSLVRIDVDVSRGLVRSEVVMPDAESFVYAEPFLVVETGGALLAMNTDRPGEPATATTAPLLGYDAYATAAGLALVTVVAEPADRFDVRLHEFGVDLAPMRETTLVDDTREDYYARLQDVAVAGDLLSVLFSFRDEKYVQNALTVVRFDLASGSTLDERRINVPILNSRYTFVDDATDAPGFLMRYRTRYGYNIVVCALEPHGPRMTELTKTRALSVPSAYLTIDGARALVFSDLAEDRRVSFASGDRWLIDRTARWSAPILGRALAATAINAVMAVFLGAVYLFFTSIPSYLTVAGLQRIRGGSRARNVRILAAGAFVSTGIKIAFTSFVVRRTPNYHFRPPGVGDEPYVYLVLVVLSVIALGLAARFVQPADTDERPVSGPFVQYLVIDAVSYTFAFLIYAVTSVLVDKI